MNPSPLSRRPALAGATAKRHGRRIRHPFFAAAVVVGLWLGVSDPSRAQTAPPTPIVPVVGHQNDAHIAEASQRFGIPEAWIRAVMRVESADDPTATSHAGAMGLMQVMPGTYAELRARYGLGANPYDPRDNILAGTAYLREMLDRYGSAGFLAAYNAGPGRWESYAYRGRPLPAETVAYMARLSPMVGGSVATSSTSPAPVDRFAWTRASLFVSITTASASTPPDEDIDATGLQTVGSASAVRLPKSEADRPSTGTANNANDAIFAIRRPQ
ncbi:lytic transglycosylase domain-containing protein [Brevundimonas sp. DS20]|uniref:lytic transglycosylase domain-containing protein n=1 Tax=Brevundimonas TaxID=41275 RepID=UPI0009E8EF6C|nr:lytic transglycosylase domain-containing protein [Brevundimonas sp. DS20]